MHNRALLHAFCSFVVVSLPVAASSGRIKRPVSLSDMNTTHPRAMMMMDDGSRPRSIIMHANVQQQCLVESTNDKPHVHGVEESKDDNEVGQDAVKEDKQAEKEDDTCCSAAGKYFLELSAMICGEAGGLFDTIGLPGNEPKRRLDIQNGNSNRVDYESIVDQRDDYNFFSSSFTGTIDI